MRFQVLSVRFHEFQVISQTNNIALAKCVCCSKPRFAVFKITNSSRIFFYHGFDETHAQKVFSSLVSHIKIQ